MLKKLKIHWLFNRSIALFLVSVLVLMSVAFFINMLGIRATGTVDNWQRYLTENSHYFLAWRIALYSVIVAGWLWAKKRIIALEYTRNKQPSTALTQRIRRIEIATVITFILLEVSNGLGR